MSANFKVSREITVLNKGPGQQRIFKEIVYKEREIVGLVEIIGTRSPMVNDAMINNIVQLLEDGLKWREQQIQCQLEQGRSPAVKAMLHS